MSALEQRLADSTAILVYAPNVPCSSPTGDCILQTSEFGPGGGYCSDIPFYDQLKADGGFCSSVLVAPDLLLTNKHCIGGTPCSEMRAVFGFYADSAGANEVTTFKENIDVYRCAEYIQSPWTFPDWAVIRLDRPVEGRTPVLMNRWTPPPPGASVIGIGYGAQLPAKARSGWVKHSENAQFLHTIDSFDGDSGSAVFSTDGILQGVHFASSVSDHYTFRPVVHCQEPLVSCPSDSIDCPYANAKAVPTSFVDDGAGDIVITDVVPLHTAFMPAIWMMW